VLGASGALGIDHQHFTLPGNWLGLCQPTASGGDWAGVDKGNRRRFFGFRFEYGTAYMSSSLVLLYNFFTDCHSPDYFSLHFFH
jgi:hypothetical protein